MKNRKVISPKNLPSRFPLVTWVVAILALDHWNAPEWLWATVITIGSIVSIVAIYLMIEQETVDIISKDKNNESN